MGPSVNRRVLPLRIKDPDFDHDTIIVREGKGSKDRALMLPASVAPDLREQLARARAWWPKNQAEGRNGAALPDALERKSCSGSVLSAWHHSAHDAPDRRQVHPRILGDLPVAMGAARLCMRCTKAASPREICWRNPSQMRCPMPSETKAR